MQATQIKVGQQYAFTTSPRKGIDDLASLSASQVRVREMGVQRFNPTGGEDQSGTWKNDGIKIDRWSSSGQWVEDTGTYKARDFLMPWREYKTERDKRNEAQRIKDEERIERLREAEARADRMKASLESFGLDVSDTGWPMPGKCSVDTAHVALSIDQAEKLLGSIAERIYEGIRDAT